MHLKKILYICIILLAAGLQSCSITARIKRADRKYQIGEYYAAADM